MTNTYTCRHCEYVNDFGNRIPGVWTCTNCHSVYHNLGRNGMALVVERYAHKHRGENDKNNVPWHGTL